MICHIMITATGSDPCFPPYPLMSNPPWSSKEIIMIECDNNKQVGKRAAISLYGGYLANAMPAPMNSLS